MTESREQASQFRVLLLTQYYPPETGACQNRLSEMAKQLVLAGYDVTVLTSVPNYPRGEIFESYRGRCWMEEPLEGVRVLRTWTYVSRHRGFYHRLLNYFSFALLAILLGIWRAGRQNAIVVESPPLFLGISGVLLGWWKRAPMIFNVSDLWPESAISMGVLHNRALIRVAEDLEDFLYKHSYVVTGQTQGIVENIRRRLPRVPVELITNGISPERFVSTESGRAAARARFDFGDRFVVGYTGLHGLAQGLETLLDAAERLSNETGILFAFIGDGPEKERLTVLAAQHHLENVRFFPPEPVGNMPAVFSALDAAVVPLKDLPLFRAALPAKLFECMAAGLPVVLSVAGEARSLVERANGGICVPPENATAIAEAIVHLARNRELASTLGHHGARYVRANYDRRAIAERFARLLPQARRVATTS